MIKTLQTEFADLKRDILELKTAQKKPSLLRSTKKLLKKQQKMNSL